MQFELSEQALANEALILAETRRAFTSNQMPHLLFRGWSNERLSEVWFLSIWNFQVRMFFDSHPLIAEEVREKIGELAHLLDEPSLFGSPDDRFHPDWVPPEGMPVLSRIALPLEAFVRDDRNATSSAA